jgi:hypothetical protein
MGGKLRPIGLVMGLVGCFWFGWGLYHLMEIGSCGGDAPPCPDDSWPYFLAMPGGIILSVVSIFLGSGFVGFTGIFVAVGLSSVLSAAVGDAEDETFAYVFGGLFLFFGLLPLAFIPFAKRKMVRAAQLVEQGSEAIGTVLEVRDTGVTINDNPRVKLRMRIEPRDGSAPFEAEKAITVSRVAIPRAGDRFPVWFDAADRSRWAFGTDVQANASPKVRALFAAAAQGKPLAPQPPAPPAAPAPQEDPIARIAQLNELRMKGALTDEEFQAAKDRLLQAL